MKASPSGRDEPSHEASAPGDEPGFMRVSRGLLSDEVVKEVQRLLATQKLKPGDRLPAERDLAVTLGVSRTVIRDAVQRLAAIGILEIRRGTGTFVREAQYLALPGPVVLGAQISREQVLQVLEARACLDVFLAGLAAERASASDLDALARHLRDVEEGPQAAKTEYAPDLGFEALIGRAAGNPFLQQMQAQVHAAFAKVWDRIGYIPRSREDRQAQHREVYAAIARGDREAACRAMTTHLDIWEKLDSRR